MCFAFDEDFSAGFDTSLRTDRLTNRTPIGRGYTIHRPINQKKEQIGTIRRNVSDLTATWFRKNLPGLFSSGLLHGELPTCELITLRKAEPFPTTADGDCLPPIYLDVLGLSHSFGAWKSTTNVGLKLSFLHDSRDAQRQYMTVAVKESRLIEAMSDLWVDRGRSSRIAYLDQILAHLMGLWAILPMLEGYGRHIREVRDSVIAVSDNRKNSLELLNMLGRHISYSVDVAAVSSELIAASSDRFPLFGLGEPFVLCDTEQQPTENLESMLVHTIRDRAKWLQQSDAAIRAGKQFGIDEFLMIQWVAPLASESPEIIVAILFSLRGHPVEGMTALISSEVNQLTLLVGSMTVIFSMSAGEVISFPLDDRQGIEFLLTTAVSLFGVLLIAKRVISWKTGAILLVLFIAHLLFPNEDARLIFAVIYLGLAVVLVATDWRRVKLLYREEPQALEESR